MNALAGILLAATGMLSLVACKGGDTEPAPASTIDWEKQEKESRDAAKERLDAIAKLESQVKSLPVIDTKTLAMPSGAELKLGEDPNHDVLFVEQLADPSKGAPLVVKDKYLLSECTGILAKRDTFNARTLGNCARLPFLVVLRTRTLVLPKVDKATSTYTPGSFDADVFVFDLATGKSLGGTHLTWASPENASLDPKDPEGDLKRMVQKEMGEKLASELDIRKY